MSEGPIERHRGASPSSTGLDPKLGGALSYLLGFVSGVIFLMIEKRDRFVRFHAFQSVATFGGILVLSAVAGFVPFFGWVAGALMGPVGFILWVVLMVKAFQGETFKLPVVGDWAEEQASR